MLARLVLQRLVLPRLVLPRWAMGLAEEWGSQAWGVYFAACLVGWIAAWKLLPKDPIVPGGEQLLPVPPPPAPAQRAAGPWPALPWDPDLTDLLDLRR